MWQFFLDRFTDPTWFIASASIMLLMVSLILWSFFRNIRRLAWFSAAGVIAALVYGVSVLGFPMVLDWLANYRAEWGFLTLSQAVEVATLFRQGLVYLLLYGFLAVLLSVSLGLFALLTFRWQRCRIILQRSLSESWMILLFTVMSVIINVVLAMLVQPMTLTVIDHAFQMASFVFCLQLFLRLADTAQLDTPKRFMEFSFAVGLTMLLIRYLADWVLLFQEQSFPVGLDQSLFLQQLFSFFLGVMIIGNLTHYFVTALFASTFFLQVVERYQSRFFIWTTRLVLLTRRASFAQRRIVLGVFTSLLEGGAFVLLASQGWTLALIPAFFLGYFALFYLLDHQEDARIRGEMVEKRIESAIG